MRPVSVHWAVRGRGTEVNSGRHPRAATQILDCPADTFMFFLIHPGRYDAVVSTAHFDLESASWLPQAVLTTAEYRPGRHSRLSRLAVALACAGVAREVFDPVLLCGSQLWQASE